MSFSFLRFVRITSPIQSPATQTAVPSASPGLRELQPQQLAQVAGGAPKGGWAITGDSVMQAPKGGWA